jgi:GntR family transcriptional repressor for pyruvate dehydrogenase complex
MSEPKSRNFGNLDRPDPLHLTIAARIGDEISGGRLAPGDRLPSEHDLAGSFKVSRNVVREAIACLRADGLVDSRQGLGAFVLDPKERTAIRIHSDVLGDQGKLRSLFELRGMLEIEAAGLAAERRSAEQLNAIAMALDVESAHGTIDAGVDADLEFHYRLAEATGNEFLCEFLSFVSQRVRQTIVAARAVHDLDKIVATTTQEHRAIYDAILRNDAQAAREAMRRHIEGAARRLGLVS